MTRAHGEKLAAVLALLVGLPMVYLYGRAMADASARHQEAPLRAVLGDDAFERLARGEKTPRHYLGNELLAPEFTLEDRHGRPWSLADQRGKTVVLNFWSITCPPCIKEMPTLEELADMARDWPSVEVVAVSTDSGWEEAAPAIQPHSHLTVLFDPDKKVVEGQFGTRLYPETWVIDPRGVVRFRYDGAFDWSSPLAVDLIRSFR
jgi:peroxiredoxin